MVAIAVAIEVALAQRLRDAPAPGATSYAPRAAMRDRLGVHVGREELELLGLRAGRREPSSRSSTAPRRSRSPADQIADAPAAAARARDEAREQRLERAELPLVAEEARLPDGDEREQPPELLVAPDSERRSARYARASGAAPCRARRGARASAIRSAEWPSGRTCSPTRSLRSARELDELLGRDPLHRVSSTSARGMSSSGSTRSTAPSSIAARGIPNTALVASSCARVGPPAARMAAAPPRRRAPCP